MKVGDLNSQSKPKRQQRVECPVSGSMYLMLRVSQIVGIAPVRFEKRPDGGRYVSVSSAMTALNFVIISTMNAFAFTGLLLDLNQTAYNSFQSSPIYRSRWTIEICTVLVIMSISGYKSPKRTNELIQCWNKVQKLSLSDYKGVSDNLKKCVAIVMYVAIEVALTLSAFNAYLSLAELRGTNKQVAYMYFFYFFGCMLVHMIEMQFIFTSLEVHKTLKSLNDEFEELKYLLIQQRRSKTSNSSKPLSKLLHDLVIKYQQLYGVVQQINNSFGSELLAVIILCFIQLAISPRAFFTTYASDGFIFYGFPLVWTVWYALSTIIVVEPCHKTQVEMKRTNWLVSYLLLETTDDQVEEELEKFFNFLISNQIEYSPMGVCKFSRGLVVLVFAKVATYIEIIMQFQSAEQRKS